MPVYQEGPSPRPQSSNENLSPNSFSICLRFRKDLAGSGVHVFTSVLLECFAHNDFQQQSRIFEQGRHDHVGPHVAIARGSCTYLQRSVKRVLRLSSQPSSQPSRCPLIQRPESDAPQQIETRFSTLSGSPQRWKHSNAEHPCIESWRWRGV